MNRLLTISTFALALTASAAPAAFAADDMLLLGDAPSTAKVNLIGKTDETISAEIKLAAEKVCAKDYEDFLMVDRCVRDTYSRGMKAAKAQLVRLGQAKPERVAFNQAGR